MTNHSQPAAAQSLFGKQPRPLWGGLTSGPHAVGFTTRFAYDHARVYDPPLPQGPNRTHTKTPRPILINVWYPAHQNASTTPLRHGQYLELDTAGDGAFDAFAQRLVPFNLGVMCDEVMGKPQADMDAAERDAFAQFLDAPTAAVRDAAPEGGPFPLVLNHQGLGGAFEDNAVLFEYLASHGYVVANSAFQSEDAVWLNIDWDLERSVKDLDFLVNALSTRPEADLGRVAVMGQSFGGQAALIWRAERNSVADAVVTLDSTMEYFKDLKNRNVDLFDGRLGRVEYLSVPLLVFASSEADPDFKRTDALRYAERYYATVAHLQHNDYICHGAVGSDIRRVLHPEDEGARLVREGYEMVCAHTLQFLDAYLKDDARAAEFLQRSAAGYRTDTKGFSLRRLEATPLPPTGKQLADLILTEGADAALALCASLGTDLREDLLNDTGHGLLRQGRSMDAIPLFARAVELYPSSVTAHDGLGEAHTAAGDTAAAIRYYERAEGLLSDEVMAADESASERASERLERVREVLERLRDQQGTG